MTDKREAVRAHYASAAMSRDCCGGPGEAVLCRTSAHYSPQDLAEIPSSAVGLSLGCANPVALADLREGEIVLDLGAGAGIDAFLAARRVGPSGRVFGLDMTDEMLNAARENQRRTRLGNVHFLKGYIESIPLAARSVDVILSNCVINLSVDKPRVFAEAFRVLRAGGRLAVADIASDEHVDAERQSDVAAWASCLTGALTRERYRGELHAAGFRAISIDDSHEVAPGFTSVLVTAVTSDPES